MNRADRYELALRRIMGVHGCEKTTSGIGDCFRSGHKIDAPYLADRVCDACHAWGVLYPELAKEMKR